MEHISRDDLVTVLIRMPMIIEEVAIELPLLLEALEVGSVVDDRHGKLARYSQLVFANRHSHGVGHQKRHRTRRSCETYHRSQVLTENLAEQCAMLVQELPAFRCRRPGRRHAARSHLSLE